MNRRDFEAEYGLTRRQVDRLVAAAREGDGTFEIPDRGRFRVRKGKGKTDPLDIVTVAAARPSAASSPGLRDRLEHMSKAELELELLRANIRKVNQQTENERQRIRAEALAEVEVEMARRFSNLRQALERMQLAPEQLKEIREALDA